MLASVLIEPGRIELREIDPPEISDGEILIQIKAALTCGTDLKAFRRGHPLMPMPTVFGHEFAGEVAEVGKDVAGFSPGDSVMAVHTAPCGACIYCSRQLENLCPTMMETKVLGAYAEYLKLPAEIVRRNTFHKPDHLSFREAAILEPLSCVVYGMESVALQPQSTVVIIGAGAIGLLHIMVAKAMGAGKIIVSGHHSFRLDLARMVGADVTIDSQREDPVSRITAETDGMGAPLVIECTGLPAVWEQATEMVSRGGNVILFGGCPSGTTATFDTARLHYDQITLKGVFHFNPAAVKKSCDYLCNREINVSPLISADRTLQDLQEVFESLITGSSIKYAIIP